MTQKQIDARRDELNKKYYGDAVRFPENLKMPISKEDAIMFKKLDIYDMMLSNLAYGGDYFEMTKESWYVRNRDENGYDWDQLEKLGVENAKEVVKAMWEDMKEDFNKYATVRHGVYEDCEGLTYNSVDWSD